MRRLVGHPAGEVQHVAQRLGLAGVGVEAGAAQRGAAGGGVDRDQGPQAGAVVLADDDLLVAAEVGEHVELKQGHGGDLSEMSRLG